MEVRTPDPSLTNIATAATPPPKEDKEALNSPPDRLLTAMKTMPGFYESMLTDATPKYERQTIESLAKRAELQARGLETRLDYAAQLAIDIQAAKGRAGEPADLATAVNIMLAPQQPTEKGLTGFLRTLNNASIGEPMIASGITAGPDELYQAFMMSTEQMSLAQKGEDQLLRQLGVLAAGQTEASLYMDPNPIRIRGAGAFNTLDDVMKDVGAENIKGKVKHIVSRGIPLDSHGAVGTLPGDDNITFLTWQKKAAIHFNLSPDAWIQAIGARMPKAEALPVAPPPVAA